VLAESSDPWPIGKDLGKMTVLMAERVSMNDDRISKEVNAECCSIHEFVGTLYFIPEPIFTGQVLVWYLLPRNVNSTTCVTQPVLHLL
jgi:hypothetical protein